jgi:regulator of replication initiation timing
LEKSYKQSLEDSTAMEQVRYLEENIEKFKKETEKLKSLLSANLEEVKDLTDTNLKLESKLKERKKKYKELEVIVGEQ